MEASIGVKLGKITLHEPSILPTARDSCIPLLKKITQGRSEVMW